MPTWLRQFTQKLLGRRVQAGGIQTRLTALLLAVALPLFIGLIVVVLSRADAVIQVKSDEQLATANRSVAANTTTWLNLNVAALNNLVEQPQIMDMDAVQQKPILEAMAASYPQMYLVSTTDPQGINVARNDAGKLTDYSDRLWYKEAIGGASLTLQSLIGRTTGRPALVASAPIQREPGVIVGVGMFASELTDVAEQVQLSTVGEAGFSYVVDANNLVVAYPQAMPEALGDVSSSVPITPLGDLSDYPPVQALRAGSRGRLEFSDEAGHKWLAYVDEMEYGWGVVVQQPVNDFLSALRGLQQIALLFIIGGVLLLLIMTVLTVRQALSPVGRLTETATVIAGGDLERTAPVESEDEFGVLASAFNRMTGRLRDLIGSLEQRVADRTADLEQRSAYLQASAEVGRAVGSILDVDALTTQVVDLIRERFKLYYVGLFLTDPAGEWAVLRAGTGEAGQAMLARGHRVQLGQGMVGWSITNAQARVALQAEADAVRVVTPELPETRSEAALPLRSRGRVLGALTVQSAETEAFDSDAVAVLQTMADQVAAALDNARLFEESQSALEASRAAYGQLTREAWQELLRAQPDIGFRRDKEGLAPVGKAAPSLAGEAPRPARVATPITVRGQTIGVIDAQKPEAAGDWTAEEVQVMETLADQLGVALEGARLFRDAQRHAAHEEAVRHVTDEMRRGLEVESILQTTVAELGRVLGVPRAYVRLGTGAKSVPSDPGSGHSPGAGGSE
jgi:GAF domain-containing protein/HAMP domain-containing protein